MLNHCVTARYSMDRIAPVGSPEQQLLLILTEKIDGLAADVQRLFSVKPVVNVLADVQLPVEESEIEEAARIKSTLKNPYLCMRKFDGDMRSLRINAVRHKINIHHLTRAGFELRPLGLQQHEEFEAVWRVPGTSTPTQV